MTERIRITAGMVITGMLTLTLAMFMGTHAPAIAALIDDKAELKLFAGAWTVVKLIEDGKVIPPERIPDILPSGGRVEIVDNTLLFVDVHTGQRHAKTITIDPTRYPSTIDIRSAENDEISRGIYRFDNGQLIVCIGDSFAEGRPTELNAPKGSGAMLIILQRRAAPPEAEKKKNAPRSAPPATTPVQPSDDNIKKMLPGVWRIPDQAGFLHINFRSNGTFATFRVHEELQLFRRVFVESPISSGSWEVREGRIMTNLATSTDPGRIGSSHLFTIRAMTSTEFIFVDGLGRSNKATRETPVKK